MKQLDPLDENFARRLAGKLKTNAHLKIHLAVLHDLRRAFIHKTWLELTAGNSFALAKTIHEKSPW